MSIGVPLVRISEARPHESRAVRHIIVDLGDLERLKEGDALCRRDRHPRKAAPEAPEVHLEARKSAEGIPRLEFLRHVEFSSLVPTWIDTQADFGPPLRWP